MDWQNPSGTLAHTRTNLFRPTELARNFQIRNGFHPVWAARRSKIRCRQELLSEARRS